MDTTPGDNQFHWKNKHARKFIFSKQLLNDNHDSQSRWVIRKALLSLDTALGIESC